MPRRALALALPLCAAMILPAEASQFDFTFSASFGNTSITDPATGTSVSLTGTYSISGRTTSGQSLAPSELTLSGPVPLSLFDGTYRLGSGGSGSDVFSNTDLSFDVTQAGPVDWPFGPGNALAFSGLFGDTTVYFLAVKFGDTNPNRLRATTAFDSGGNVDFLTTDAVPSANRRITPLSGTATLVPEINGSGFAYIAFILGALGLWLYSGAGRGRQEEAPAVA